MIDFDEDAPFLIVGDSRPASPPGTPRPALVDVQGVPWESPRHRDAYRAQRDAFLRRAHLPGSSDYSSVASAARHPRPVFAPRHMLAETDIAAGHAQLRQTLAAPLPALVLCAADRGRALGLWDAGRSSPGLTRVLHVPSACGPGARVSALWADAALGALVGTTTGGVVLLDRPWLADSRGVVMHKTVGRAGDDCAGVNSIAHLIGGAFALAVNSGALVSIDAADCGRTRLLWHSPSPVNALSVSQDCTVALGCDDCSVSLLDVRAAAPHCRMDGHAGPVFALAWLDGRTLASGGEDGAVRLWDTRDTSVPLDTAHAAVSAVRGLHYCKHYGVLAVAEHADYVSLYDAGRLGAAGTLVPAGRVDFFGEAAGAAFAPDASRLFVAVEDCVRGGIIEAAVDEDVNFIA